MPVCLSVGCFVWLLLACPCVLLLFAFVLVGVVGGVDVVLVLLVVQCLWFAVLSAMSVSLVLVVVADSVYYCCCCV